jgi:hypothetical protein
MGPAWHGMACMVASAGPGVAPGGLPNHRGTVGELCFWSLGPLPTWALRRRESGTRHQAPGTRHRGPRHSGIGESGNRDSSTRRSSTHHHSSRMSECPNVRVGIESMGWHMCGMARRHPPNQCGMDVERRGVEWNGEERRGEARQGEEWSGEGMCRRLGDSRQQQSRQQAGQPAGDQIRQRRQKSDASVEGVQCEVR